MNSLVNYWGIWIWEARRRDDVSSSIPNSSLTSEYIGDETDREP